MVLALIIVLIVAAAGAAAWFFGPPAWRENTVRTVKGFPGSVRGFIERGRAPEVPAHRAVGAGAVPRPPRFSDADRAYLSELWKHVQTKFVADPQVAVDLAHSTASGFFKAHGVDVTGMPAAANGFEQLDTEELRKRLLAIKAWADREVAA